MPKLTKDHAIAIAKKCEAKLVKKKRHDFYEVWHDGKMISQFGLRRGSKKDAGHGHLPAQLGLRPREAWEMAICTISKEKWLELLDERELL